MLLQAAFFVFRYSLNTPFVDEWDFVPALFGEEPWLPWLWDLHNEHRFPLPRIIYFGLFQIAHDFRVGCWLSLFLVAVLSIQFMNFARAIRGQSSVTDAIFPMLLMHSGQSENLYMGYQICFAMSLIFASWQLLLMLSTNSVNQYQRGWQVGLLSLADLMCGAAGLVYGSVGILWVGFLTIRHGLTQKQRVHLFSFVVVAFCYVVAYRSGYRRPGHHPPSAGLFESIRVGLEAQSVAIGPSATGIWPFVGIVVGGLGIATLVLILRSIRNQQIRTEQAMGLFATLLGAAGVSFGIGWGRSGFEEDMGFAWRYGWITFPAILTTWFTGILLLKNGIANWFQRGFFLAVIVMTPINSISGFRDGEKSVRSNDRLWNDLILDGKTPIQIADVFYPDSADEFRDRMMHSMRIFKKHRFSVYVHLHESETP